MKKILLWMIRFYRKNISPLKSSKCMYIPTCSEYAMQAIEKYGAAKGSYMAVRRILRCHPFKSAKNYDPYDPVL